MSLSAPWPSVTNPDGTLNPQAVQDNMDKLFMSMIATGGTQLAIRAGGPQNVSWPGASPFSNIMTVSHGLGKTPTSVVPGLMSGGAAGFVSWQAFNFTDTTFDLRMGTVDGSSPAAAAVSTATWVAVG